MRGRRAFALVVALAAILAGLVWVIAIGPPSSTAGPPPQASAAGLGVAPSAASAIPSPEASTPAASSSTNAAASRLTPRPSSSLKAGTTGAVTAGAGTTASGPTTNATTQSPAPAPTSPLKFDPRHTVVPILFPLPKTASYTYAAFWREPRDGVVYPYNQIHGVTKTGTLLRAHDGVDIQVKIGTPVLAPFAGTVVDPTKIWKPWDPERYGNVVVIRSAEPLSAGYYTILVHLSKKNVAVGATVKRGQVVGRTGISGNAAETIPHLHFELRTPFQVEFHYAGVERFLDSFDPLPSLYAADPKRH